MQTQSDQQGPEALLLCYHNSRACRRRMGKHAIDQILNQRLSNTHRQKNRQFSRCEQEVLSGDLQV